MSIIDGLMVYIINFKQINLNRGMIEFKKFMHASIPTLNFSFPTSGLISKKTVLNVIPVFGGSDKLSDYILLIFNINKTNHICN